MPANTPRAAPAPRRYPLHVHIATLAIALIVVAGGVIGWFNYVQHARLVVAAADRVFDGLHRELVADLEQGSQLNHTTVEMLARTRVGAAASLDERLASLPLFREALRRNDRLNSLYVGYDDGEFFQVLPLRTAAQRELYKAPAAAAYVVWSIETRAGGAARSVYLFFDAALRPLGERNVESSPYDPRQRPWYAAARAAEGLAVTPPYVFFTTREVGATIARRSPAGSSVVAGDVTLARLSAILAAHSITPSAELAIVAANGDVLAHRDPERIVHREPGGAGVRLATVDTLGAPILAQIASAGARDERRRDFESGGRTWFGVQRHLPVTEGTSVNLLMAAPEDELVVEAARIRRQSLLVTALLILGVAPIAWLASRLLSTPLRKLAAEARAIREFDFSPASATRSIVREIDHLADAMDSMKATVRDFLGLSADLAAEHRFEALLEKVCREAMQAVDADGGILYLLDEDDVTLRPAAAHPLRVADLSPQAIGADERAAPGATGLKATAIALKNPQGHTVGVLRLLHRADRPDLASKTSRERLAFVEALAGVAAAAIDNQRLVKAQKDLLDAFIKLVAGAIDAKSPYTGGHCQRVPVLTKMLTRAACDSEAAPFRDFTLTEDGWETLDIACWLHDCGKVTTPEFVVDKATKLETLCDRIHEIRTRFEVLKRDAEIACWKRIAAGDDRAASLAALEREARELDREFAFVAECNEGGEFMAPDRIARLRKIAERTWMRTLDDRLGVSWEERGRKEREPAPPLPAPERLLADKPEHIVLRPPEERIPADNPWGFRIEVPEHKYNRGELHNLAIGRGTLTAEERYVINDHIVQTIVMLSRLPFPKHLRRAPEFAGGHHEKLDGTGYPKRLAAGEMSLPARAMAIADIFEALTAADRPYKKAKKLSESIGIMDRMRADRHIDPDLFALFLSSGVYREYAEQHLLPGQIDEVDVARYVAAASAPATAGVS
jgi:HD-GYP domain-containing protein (c-di-GMP phosphodiesterase class II)